jgi:hypothetical protein
MPRWSSEGIFQLLRACRHTDLENSNPAFWRSINSFTECSLRRLRTAGDKESPILGQPHHAPADLVEVMGDSTHPT